MNTQFEVSLTDRLNLNFLEAGVRGKQKLLKRETNIKGINVREYQNTQNEGECNVYKPINIEMLLPFPPLYHKKSLINIINVLT